MRALFAYISLPFLTVLTTGCVTTTPPTAVHQPMTVRPQAIAASGSNGSIFSSVQSRPLFEDRHARMVGDVLANTQAASRLLAEDPPDIDTARQSTGHP